MPAFAWLFTIILAFSATLSHAQIRVDVTYLRYNIAPPPVLSNLDPIPHDLGLAGAKLALEENKTTGKFLGHTFSLSTVIIEQGEDLKSAALSALAASPYLILDVPMADLLSIADLPEAKEAILFNAAAPDLELRNADCRANLLHTLPSNAMRTDALMQFVRLRRWEGMALITGTHAKDLSFAAALKASATKFGLSVGAEKTWAFDADMRRNAAQEVPLFTQDLGDYDLLLVADETHDFGRYIAYNTWLARPIIGSEGLVATTWSPVIEQWGAAQLQSRFHQESGRDMRPIDYAAWAAFRALGEAVTRTNTSDAKVIHSFLMSDKFELAGFKGRPLSFRSWNGQLRQPILLVTQRAVVAQAPLPGYLHQRSEMDTLGLDKPESACHAFQ